MTRAFDHGLGVKNAQILPKKGLAKTRNVCCANAADCKDKLKHRGNAIDILLVF